MRECKGAKKSHAGRVITEKGANQPNTLSSKSFKRPRVPPQRMAEGRASPARNLTRAEAPGVLGVLRGKRISKIRRTPEIARPEAGDLQLAKTCV